MDSGFSRETIKGLITHALKGRNARHHITRVAMYKALADRWAHLDSAEATCLAVSRSANLGRILGLKKCAYTEADYPEHDMADLRFDDCSFDFCVSDQVLEHVGSDPFDAFCESVRVVRMGGWICHTTCLINPVHAPPDYWRFTTAALRLLASKAGCELLESEGWGNREAWALIDAGFRYAKIPNDETNPLYKLATFNEPDWPIVTWVIAQKRRARPELWKERRTRWARLRQRRNAPAGGRPDEDAKAAHRPQNSHAS